METAIERPRRAHQGRNVKRFREMLGIKQEALAHELGEDWSQKRVSLLESKVELQQFSGDFFLGSHILLV